MGLVSIILGLKVNDPLLNGSFVFLEKNNGQRANLASHAKLISRLNEVRTFRVYLLIK